MKVTQKQLTAFRWLQEAAVLAILLTLVAYDFGIISRLVTHQFWIAEVVIYYTIDFFLGTMFNKQQ